VFGGSALDERQIIQVGRWTTSKKWLQSCFTIGNYEITGSYFDNSLIICTEHSAGSAHELIQTAKRPPYFHDDDIGHKRRREKKKQSFVPNDTTRTNRSKQMVWFSATLEEPDHSPEFPVFRDGPPDGCSKISCSDNTNIYYWPSKLSLIQQRPRIHQESQTHSITWHLLVPTETFRGYPGLLPSDLFNLRRNYWAETINSKGVAESPDDLAMPKNTAEELLGKQDICHNCACALNGSWPDDDAATELIEVESPFGLAPHLKDILNNLLFVLTLKRNV
jgi:hypothetical protein